MIKSLTQFTDDILSSWLNVTVKTFRNYKREDVDFKDNMKEQIILLLSLIKHGIEVFEDNETFEDWLVTSNFYFGDQQPISYLNTVSGIRFVQSRLTAIEYGDNV